VTFLIVELAFQTCAAVEKALKLQHKEISALSIQLKYYPPLHF